MTNPHDTSPEAERQRLQSDLDVMRLRAPGGPEDQRAIRAAFLIEQRNLQQRGY
jgi:hypothetical protein